MMKVAATIRGTKASATHFKAGSYYVPEIDGLRAIAVGSVILYHLSASVVPGGFTGVDIFFVISGYVVSRSLARDAETPLLQMLREFYARRIQRIVPALLVCLLLSIFATVLFIPKSWLSNANERTASFAFWGASNIALFRLDHYFSPRSEFNPFTQTWSLGVEEQFYALYPIMFWLWYKSVRRVDRERSFHLSALLPVTTLLSFVLMWGISSRSQDAAFYLLPSRFWELGVGAFVFQMECGRADWLGIFKLGRAGLLLGIVAIGVGLAFADEGAFPFPWAIPPVIGTALVVSALIGGGKGNRFPVAILLRSPPMVFLGKISYSLYLWHWPVYTLFRWTVGLASPECKSIAVGLTFGLACASYYFVEQPVRSGNWLRRRHKGLIIAGGLVSIGLGWEVAQLAFENQYNLALSVVMRHPTDWYPQTTPGEGDTSSCKVKGTSGSAGDVVFDLLQPACIGGGSPSEKLFVIGDSHTLAYSPMLSLFAGRTAIEVRSYSGCASLSLLYPTPSFCFDAAQHIIEDVLRRAKPGDLVFLASLRMYRSGDQDGPYARSVVGGAMLNSKAVAERRAAYQEAVGILQRFMDKGLFVIIDAPTPIFRSAAFRCSDWFNSMNPSCANGLAIGRDYMLNERRPVMEALGDLSAKYPHLSVWDPFPIICPSDPCRAVGPSGPLFFDNDHLSNFGNRVLFPSFLSTIEQLLAAESSVPAVHDDGGPGSVVR